LCSRNKNIFFYVQNRGKNEIIQIFTVTIWYVVAYYRHFGFIIFTGISHNWPAAASSANIINSYMVNVTGSTYFMEWFFFLSFVLIIPDHFEKKKEKIIKSNQHIRFFDILNGYFFCLLFLTYRQSSAVLKNSILVFGIKNSIKDFVKKLNESINFILQFF
jgi:hypothetical protein